MAQKKPKIEFELADLYNRTVTEPKKIGDKHHNLGEEVYTIIRNKIISHELKPGDRVVDKHLADELGVSRSLTRQALTILEKQELVTLVPRSGFYVTKITRQDVEEIYDLRKLLETHATRIAVPIVTEQEINEVEKIFEEGREELEKEKVKRFIEADASLHDLLINNSKNQRLIKTLNQYNNQFIFYRLADLCFVERAKDSYVEHIKILNAIKARDVDLAAKLMTEHIEHAKQIILNNFESYTFG